MKYLKKFESKKEFKMIDDIKEISYILQDENITVIVEDRDHYPTINEYGIRYRLVIFSNNKILYKYKQEFLDRCSDICKEYGYKMDILSKSEQIDIITKGYFHKTGIVFDLDPIVI